MSKVYENTPSPSVGQTWEECDPRHNPKRRIKIEALDTTHAICLTLNRTEGERFTTRVRLDRLKPIQTGWRYVSG